MSWLVSSSVWILTLPGAGSIVNVVSPTGPFLLPPPRLDGSILFASSIVFVVSGAPGRWKHCKRSVTHGPLLPPPRLDGSILFASSRHSPRCSLPASKIARMSWLWVWERVGGPRRASIKHACTFGMGEHQSGIAACTFGKGLAPVRPR